MAVAAGVANMEIKTTIRDFSKKIGGLNVSPETPIRVIIQEMEIPKKTKAKAGESYLPFLDR